MGKNSKQSFFKKTRILKIPTLTLFSMILVLIMTMNIVGCAMVTSTFKSLKTNEIAKETPYVLEEKILLEEAEKSDRAEYIETEVATGGEIVFNPQVTTLERMIIYHGNIELEVEKGKFSEKFEQIGNITRAAGGFVSNTSSRAYGDEPAIGTITIKVPSENFNSVIDQIKKLGNVKNLNTYADEVTQEYVDLNSRLKHFQAQEKVLLQMMDKSGTIEDSIAVHRELSSVQEQIEIIKGRLRWLDEQISFSTITISVSEPHVKPQPYPIRWEFLDTLREGVRAIIKVIDGLVLFMMIISPIVFLVVIGFLIVRYVLKRRKSKKEI
ncbi:MAG: DUF4349 domain-containing protein [Actinobacteria bacterium]|nr:DUF4349 domain-containing protein [Actinomycetota bacterium]